MKVTHELEPIYHKDSEILILGSIPSVKSRELGFYYAHPQNRFWKVLATIYQEKLPNTIDEKKEFLKRHKIALWDVLSSCTINKSSDASIKNIKVNNIEKLIKETNIQKIYTTGKKSYDIYQKEILPKTKIEAIYLPSTSPANATYTLEKLVKEYSIINNETYSKIFHKKNLLL